MLNIRRVCAVLGGVMFLPVALSAATTLYERVLELDDSHQAAVDRLSILE